MLPCRDIGPFLGENAQVSLENALKKKYSKKPKNMLFQGKIYGLVGKKVFLDH